MGGGGRQVDYLRYLNVDYLRYFPNTDCTLGYGAFSFKLATDMFCCHIPPLRVKILLAMILFGGYYGDGVAKLHKQTNKQTKNPQKDTGDFKHWFPCF